MIKYAYYIYTKEGFCQYLLLCVFHYFIIKSLFPSDLIKPLSSSAEARRLQVLRSIPDLKAISSALIPGASIGYHVHENETELFYFLEGNGRFQDDDRIFDISAGDSTATFSGHGHAVENTGDTNLVLLACIVKD